jgi:hypothetical protein
VLQRRHRWTAFGYRHGFGRHAEIQCSDWSGTYGRNLPPRARCGRLRPHDERQGPFSRRPHY